MIGGPGWVIPGVLKMLGGALLAYLAIGYAVPLDRAVDPNQMYLVAYGAVFSHLGMAVAATALFVIISQLKINVTNAYAGSLAWSNFFARLTHSHPGRVVWMVFNILIALMLMELNVFQALGKVLGLYSQHRDQLDDGGGGRPGDQQADGLVAQGHRVQACPPVRREPGGRGRDGGGLGAVDRGLPGRLRADGAGLLGADRAGHGPAGVAADRLAHRGPLLPRAPAAARAGDLGTPAAAPAGSGAPAAGQASDGSYKRLTRCVICERDYEHDDMAHCPAYRGSICSLCCSLDARCHDLCKPHARLSVQWRAAAQRLVPAGWWQRLDTELGHYLMLMALGMPALAGLFLSVYRHERRTMEQGGPVSQAADQALQLGFVKLYAALLVISAVVAWWLVLKHRSAQVAQEESNRQTHLLVHEIESHRRTDEALQEAKQLADRAKHLADQANQAKSRYITTISHELRTPLNSIIGYAQLLDEDASIPPHRKQAVSVIRRGGDHLLSLIEGTLDLARIEGGKLSLDVRPVRLREGLQQIAHLFELQAAGKGIAFRHVMSDSVPEVVRADEKRLRQILINLLGNAVKFTQRGEVVFRVTYAREMATFEIEDTGPGIAPEEMAQIFEPFGRGSASGAGGGSGPAGSTGLGLTISKMLTDLMGGELTVHARAPAGSGSIFRIRLFLPEVRSEVADGALPRHQRVAYAGARQRLLVVDNEEVDRDLMVSMLTPLGFEVRTAASGQEAWRCCRRSAPMPS